MYFVPITNHLRSLYHPQPVSDLSLLYPVPATSVAVPIPVPITLTPSPSSSMHFKFSYVSRNNIPSFFEIVENKV